MKKNNIDHLIFENSETVEDIFEKIKGWELESQLNLAVSFDKYQRDQFFSKI